MGTSNFHTANAQATYVIDYADDEYIWQEATEHLGQWIHELDPTFELSESIESKEELRSFPASSVGYWSYELTYLNILFEVHVNLFLRSGYYEAANLDYEVQWFMEGCDYYNDVDSILSELDFSPTTYDINQGLWTIHKSNLESNLVQLESNAVSQVEAILAQVSTPYGVAAQFSNGETIYTKLKE